MLKKICFLIMVVLLCCCLTVPVFSQDYPVSMEKIDVSGEDLQTRSLDEDSTILEIVETDTESVIEATTIEKDPEWLQRHYGTPKEILSGSTAKLLEFFMESDFMCQQELSYASSVPVKPVVLDYTYHTAFSELITRKDFLKQLDHYAENALGKITDFNADEVKLKKVLEQAPVKALMGNVRNFSSQYPNLQSLQVESDTTVAATAVGDYVDTINGINYYSAGTISTASNLSVEVCVADGELSPTQINNFNNKTIAGATRLTEPTAVFNCHSYAWYRYANNNPYWIMDITQFKNDGACTQIAKSSVQEKDIIVYLDANGNPLHSGVVYSVSSSGAVTICSKWGQAGVYLHAVNSVPNEYCSNPYTGETTHYFYRYHDYSYGYTRNEYHSGTRHYFQYADICDVCKKQVNTIWRSVACSGPPCTMPFGMTPIPEIM